MSSCTVLETSNTTWIFCPSIIFAYIAASIFAVISFALAVQALGTKKIYCWVIVFSGLLQALSYVFRILSIQDPASFAKSVVMNVLILVSPVFMTAFVYLVMERMIRNYVQDGKLMGKRAQSIGKTFLLADICAFLLQTIGALQMIVRDDPFGHRLIGQYLYIGGLGVQQCTIFAFVFISVKFNTTIFAQLRRPDEDTLLASMNAINSFSAIKLLYVIYAALILITIRITFRIYEFVPGTLDAIRTQEAYQYLIDSVPMAATLILFIIWHPGWIMRGVSHQNSAIEPWETESGDVTLSKLDLGLLADGKRVKLRNARPPTARSYLRLGSMRLSTTQFSDSVLAELPQFNLRSQENKRATRSSTNLLTSMFSAPTAEQQKPKKDTIQDRRPNRPKLTVRTDFNNLFREVAESRAIRSMVPGSVTDDTNLVDDRREGIRPRAMTKFGSKAAESREWERQVNTEMGFGVKTEGKKAREEAMRKAGLEALAQSEREKTTENNSDKEVEIEDEVQDLGQAETESKEEEELGLEAIEEVDETDEEPNLEQESKEEILKRAEEEAIAKLNAIAEQGKLVTAAEAEAEAKEET